MAGRKSQGTDFDELFDPDIVGDGPQAAGYNSNGVAIRYAHIQYGTKRADVGYRVNGLDVSNLWAAKGTASYSINGLQGRNFNVSQSALTSSGNVSSSLTVSLFSDGTWLVTGATSTGAKVLPSPVSGVWLPTGGSAADYSVQFDAVVSGTGQQETVNGAPTYSALSSNRQFTLSLPPLASTNTITRSGSAQLRIRIKRTSTGTVISDTTLELNVSTSGFA